jgi:hypothetical protein
VPEFLGTRVIANQSLRELVDYIDWTPFFHAWELRGVWDREAKVLKTKNEEGAKEAAKLHAEALVLLDRIIAESASPPVESTASSRPMRMGTTSSCGATSPAPRNAPASIPCASR